MEKTFIGYAAEINGGRGIGWMSCCSHVSAQTQEEAETDRKSALVRNPKAGTRIVKYYSVPVIGRDGTVKGSQIKSEVVQEFN